MRSTTPHGVHFRRRSKGVLKSPSVCSDPKFWGFSGTSPLFLISGSISHLSRRPCLRLRVLVLFSHCGPNPGPPSRPVHRPRGTVFLCVLFVVVVGGPTSPNVLVLIDSTMGFL